MWLIDAAPPYTNELWLETNDLEARGFPTELQVTSQPEPDTTPPELVEFDFTPKAIDTRYGPQDVEITIHARDDLTGVSWVMSDN